MSATNEIRVLKIHGKLNDTHERSVQLNAGHWHILMNNPFQDGHPYN